MGVFFLLRPNLRVNSMERDLAGIVGEDRMSGMGVGNLEGNVGDRLSRAESEHEAASESHVVMDAV